MKRLIYNDLLEWKNKKSYKPLLVLGARQVGKTYIIREFCKNEFDNYVELNLKYEKDVVNKFESNINSDVKFDYLKRFVGLDFESENNILFVDEIQESEDFLSELKYINEVHPNARIICAGSLLGLAIKRCDKSFPVGKVSFLNMYPMNFEEFLIATNNEFLKDEILNSYKNDLELSESLHNEAIEIYKQFLYLGGMPEVISNFVDSNCDLTKFDLSIKTEILKSYRGDMTKYIRNASEKMKIERLFESIPSQLKEQNPRFFVGRIDSNARIREYESAMEWLKDANIALMSYVVKNPQIPLEGMKSFDDFKIFLFDVGILCEMLGVTYSNITKNDLEIYKGSLVENYVAQELTFMGKKLYYWLSDYTGEIDFLLQDDDSIIPVEVKAGTSNKSKSLGVYMNKYNPKYGIRVSLNNFEFSNNIKNIPLYSLWCINK